MAARLRARRVEIEQAALTRVQAVSGPARAVGPEYADGLRGAVSAAVCFGIDGLERGDGSIPGIPTVLLAQARLAARNGVGLETVLRRYAAGYALLSQFIANEAEAMGMAVADLLEIQTALFDRLVEAVTDEYGREQGQPGSVHERRLRIARTLLAGGFADTSAFAYDFDSHHVAVIARGNGAEKAVRDIAELFDSQRLTILPAEDTVWCWLASSDPPPIELLGSRGPDLPEGTVIAVGEPGIHMAGWRQTHEQAQAALPIATRRPATLVRYRDVALLASIAQDELLTNSLHEIYIRPLRQGRSGDDALVETLRAYFASGRNSASAAAAMRLSRQTVNYRLRMIEERIGRSLSACASTVEVALELDTLGRYPETASAIGRT